ncbi:MAG: hypothetical protein QME96_14645 [Myxococcota bacterium]|nr:hypothetical protein [Myxococcota bacterium]
MYQMVSCAQAALVPGRPGPEPGWKEVARLQAEKAELRERVRVLEATVAERDEVLRRSVEVTQRRLAAVELVCFASNVSLRGTQEIVEAAFGEEYRPGLGSLQEQMVDHEKVARDLLDQARGQVRERLRCVMADDVYFHRVDVKVVADPDTMALLNLGRWKGSSGLDWAIWLEEYPNLDLVVSDLGKDLVGAVGQLGLPHAADFFHEMRWFDQKVLEPLSRAEAALREEWMRSLDRATRVEGPGRRLSPAREEAARLRAEAAEREFFTAMTAVDRIRDLYDPINPRTRRLWTDKEAESALDEVIAMLSSLHHPAGRRGARHVREHRRRYYAHLVVFDAIEVPLRSGADWHPRSILNGLIRLWDLRRGLDEPGEWRDYADWLDRRRLADTLERHLRRQCLDLDAVAVRLRKELHRPKRSSSGIESLNSRLRVLQMVHRNVSDGMLALYALSWNLKPREAGDPRGGDSPYDALGVDIGQGGGKPWYDVLLDAEDRAKLAA